MEKSSKTEDVLNEALNAIGLYPKRQYPISQMHVDFAFPENMLVVEIDGAYHRTREGMRTVYFRREVAEKLGWKVKNYTAEDVFENPQYYAWKIREAIVSCKKEQTTLTLSKPKQEIKVEEPVQIKKKEPFVWKPRSSYNPETFKKKEVVIDWKARKRKAEQEEREIHEAMKLEREMAIQIEQERQKKEARKRTTKTKSEEKAEWKKARNEMIKSDIKKIISLFKRKR